MKLRAVRHSVAQPDFLTASPKSSSSVHSLTSFSSNHPLPIHNGHLKSICWFTAGSTTYEKHTLGRNLQNIEAIPTIVDFSNCEGSTAVPLPHFRPPLEKASPNMYCCRATMTGQVDGPDSAKDCRNFRRGLHAPATFIDVCPVVVDRAEANAQRRLQARQLHRVPSVTGKECTAIMGPAADLYFVTGADIKDMVKTVVNELLAAPDDSGEAKNQTRLKSETTKPRSPVLPEVDSRRKSITPRLSAAAEPATTLSMPRTVFSHTLWDGMQQLPSDADSDESSKTTVVSHSNLAEISWSENVSRRESHEHFNVHDNHTDSDVGSTKATQGSRPVSKPSIFNMICASEYPPEKHIKGPIQPTYGGLALIKRGSRSTDDESSMTSFPELRPRQCTSDWLNPPAQIDYIERSPSADLYHRGVDAHSGVVSHRTSLVWEDPITRLMPSDQIVFNRDPFCCTSAYFHERRATEGSNGAEKRRLGSSIGSAAHRRRSSYNTVSQKTHWDCQVQTPPNVLDRVLRVSQTVFNQHIFARRDENINGSGFEDDHAGSVRPRDSIVRERTLKPPEADTAGIYEAMTGSRMVANKTHITCSEDHRQHVCDGDRDSRV